MVNTVDYDNVVGKFEIQSTSKVIPSGKVWILCPPLSYGLNSTTTVFLQRFVIE